MALLATSLRWRGGLWCAAMAAALCGLLAVAGGCSFQAGGAGGMSTPMRAAAGQTPRVELRHPSGQVSAGLQISPVSGYPTIMVHGGRSTAGRFILDTGGTGALIVTDAFLKQVGGRRLPGRSALVGATHYPLATIPELHIGDGLVLHNAPAIVSDLAQMRKVCGNIPIDGVLTVGLLRDIELDIDLPNRVVHFRPASARTVPAEAIVLRRPPGRADDPRPFALLRIGAVEVPTLLDTGNFEALDLPQHLFEPTGLSLESARDSYGAAGFSSHAARTKRGSIEQMTLGSIMLDATDVHLLPHAQVTEAVLGIAVLQHYRLIFNTRTGTALLIGPNHLSGIGPGADVIELTERICRQRLR